MSLPSTARVCAWLALTIIYLSGVLAVITTHPPSVISVARVALSFVAQAGATVLLFSESRKR